MSFSVGANLSVRVRLTRCGDFVMVEADGPKAGDHTVTGYYVPEPPLLQAPRPWTPEAE